jgi:hypothetical protein
LSVVSKSNFLVSFLLGFLIESFSAISIKEASAKWKSNGCVYSVNERIADYADFIDYAEVSAGSKNEIRGGE